MFELIETKIEEYLKSKGAELLADIFANVSFEEIDPKNLSKWARGAVINAYTTGGSHTADNFETRRTVDISILVLSEDPRDIIARRAKAGKLINSIIALLTYQQLGLDIQPLAPGRFREITTQELSDIGMMAWQIDFSTEYSIDILPEEPETTLMGIDVSYGDGTGDSIETPYQEADDGF